MVDALPAPAHPSESSSRVVRCIPPRFWGGNGFERQRMMFGRGHELAQAEPVLRRAAAGGPGGVVVVRGVPGIGKTAFVSGIRQTAGAAGMRVLRGAALQLERDIAFAAVRSCLRPGTGPSDPLPALARLLESAGSTSQWPHNREFAVAESVLTLMKAWCENRPVALILDDAQWADPMSLMVLQQLGEITSAISLVVVIAMRPIPGDTPLTALTDRLQAAGAQQIHLGPLSDKAVEQLAARTLGRPAGTALLQMTAAAAGNPMYVKEVLAALRATRAIEVADGTVELIEAHQTPGELCPLPHAVADAVLRGFDFLPSTARRMLSMIAVLGTSIDVTDLAAVLDTPVLDVWSAVTTALDTGLVLRTFDGLAFGHDLVRAAFADQVPEQTRRALKRRAAQILIDAGASPVRVAHYLSDEDCPIDARSIEWLIQTLDSLVADAPETALRLVERACSVATLDSTARESLQAKKIRILLNLGRFADAEMVARAATDGHLSRNCERLDESGVRWQLIESCFGQGHLDDVITESATALSWSGHLGTRGRFTAAIALARAVLGQLAEAESAAHDAITQGMETGSATPDLAWMALSLVRGSQDDPKAALQLVDKARAAFTTKARGNGGEDLYAFLSRVLRAQYLIELDHLSEAQSELESTSDDARSRHGICAEWIFAVRARLRYLNGGRPGTDPRPGQNGSDGTELGSASGAEQLLGIGAIRFAETLSGLDAADTVPGLGDSPAIALGSWADALVQESRGCPDLAWMRMACFLRDARTGVGSAPAYYAYPDAVRMALSAHDTSAASDIATAASQLAQRLPTASRRATALLCQGLIEQEPEMLTESAREFGSAHRPLYEAQARENAAVLFARRDRIDEARTELDQAIRLYVVLGAKRDLARAEKRLRGYGVRCRTRPARRPQLGWSALTPSERKIADLVAAGMSNSEIAAKLYLSPRTVQTHVSSILGKLGAKSRVEVAVGLSRRAEQRDRKRA